MQRRTSTQNYLHRYTNKNIISEIASLREAKRYLNTNWNVSDNIWKYWGIHETTKTPDNKYMQCTKQNKLNLVLFQSEPLYALKQK